MSFFFVLLNIFQFREDNSKFELVTPVRLITFTKTKKLMHAPIG